MFGDGSDGAITFDGTTTVLGLVPSSLTYTLNRSIFCSSITVNGTVIIKTAGFKIFCTGTLTNNGTISNQGGAGGAGGASTGGTAGTAGIAVPAGDLGGSGAGGLGGLGATGNGGNGAAGTGVSFSMGNSGGAGGPSGAGGGAQGDLTALVAS